MFKTDFSDFSRVGKLHTYFTIHVICPLYILRTFIYTTNFCVKDYNLKRKFQFVRVTLIASVGRFAILRKPRTLEGLHESESVFCVPPQWISLKHLQLIEKESSSSWKGAAAVVVERCWSKWLPSNHLWDKKSFPYVCPQMSLTSCLMADNTMDSAMTAESILDESLSTSEVAQRLVAFNHRVRNGWK